MSDTPVTDAHDEAYTQVSYQELAGRFEADNARLAAQLVTSTEKIDYSDKGVLDALFRDNARLAAELAEARYIAGPVDLGLISQLKAELAEARKEVERFGKATIELTWSSPEYPFNSETLNVIDVGVSDNIYVVSSEKLNETLAELAEAKSALTHQPWKDAVEAGLDEIAKLRIEMAEFERTEPLKVAERNKWRDKAIQLKAELTEARDACKAALAYMNGDHGLDSYEIYQTIRIKLNSVVEKAQVSK